MMTTAPDALAAIDWHWQGLQCQCDHHRDGCLNQATHIVALHAIDRCNQPGLDDDGNRLEIRCASCITKLTKELTAKLKHLRRFGPLSCATCGAPVAAIDDILRARVLLE